MTKRITKTLVFALSVLISTNILAESRTVFKFRKSYNPRNEVHYFAKTLVENDCQFENLNNAPVNPLWYMGEEDGHYEGLSSKEKSFFFPSYSYKKPNELKFTFEVIKQIASHLETTSFKAISSYNPSTNTCEIKALMTWGGEDIVIDDVYTKGRFWFFTWETEYVEFRGHYLSGQPFYKKIQVR